MDDAKNSYLSTAEILLQIKAIKLNINNLFTWASGLKSPIYCDNRLLLSYPNHRNSVADDMAQFISKNHASVELIAGVATGGIGIGILIAEKLDLPFMYVRPKAKQHGTMTQLEGSYRQGQNVVVIEDLISTGQSSIRAVETLRDNHLNTMGIVAIFSYGFAEASYNMKQANISYHATTNFNYLLEKAKKMDDIDADSYKRILEWYQTHNVLNRSKT